jgi:HemY protein
VKLLDEYARAQSFPSRDQLERVENWLRNAPPSGPVRAALLRSAGQICLREQLWGKSRTYLLESIAEDKQPSAFLALARLADAIGDEREAADYYREAAIGYASLPPSEPAAFPLRAREMS